VARVSLETGAVLLNDEGGVETEASWRDAGIGVDGVYERLFYMK